MSDLLDALTAGIERETGPYWAGTQPYVMAERVQPVVAALLAHERAHATAAEVAARGYRERAERAESNMRELAERAEKVEAERDALAAWKAGALPVLDGLQELGRALGLPLGERITGPNAVASAEQIKAERDALRAEARSWEEKAVDYAEVLESVTAERDALREPYLRIAEAARAWAWADRNGDDLDVRKAERTLLAAVDAGREGAGDERAGGA